VAFTCQQLQLPFPLALPVSAKSVPFPITFPPSHKLFDSLFRQLTFSLNEKSCEYEIRQFLFDL